MHINLIKKMRNYKKKLRGCQIVSPVVRYFCCTLATLYLNSNVLYYMTKRKCVMKCPYTYV